MFSSVKAVGLGSCTVDYFALTPRLIKAEEKIIVKKLEVHAGGVTFNNLTQMARLGVKSGWFGKIGDDDNGRIILKAMQDDDMDTSHVEIVKGKRSTFCWLPVDPQGARSIYMFPNVTAEITPEEIEEKHRDYIKQAKVFHTEVSQIPLPAVIKAIEIAREAGVRVVLDLDVDPTYAVEVAGLGTREELLKVIESSNVVKPCQAAAEELTGESNPAAIAKKLLKLGPGLVALTAGDRGCLIATEEEMVKVPAFKVNVVDTTGAGDAFQGGLSYAIMQGWDLEMIGKFANACAALCCTRVGARSMFGLEEVNKLIVKGEYLT